MPHENGDCLIGVLVLVIYFHDDFAEKLDFVYTLITLHINYRQQCWGSCFSMAGSLKWCWSRSDLAFAGCWESSLDLCLQWFEAPCGMELWHRGSLESSLDLGLQCFEDECISVLIKMWWIWAGSLNADDWWGSYVWVLC